MPRVAKIVTKKFFFKTPVAIIIKLFGVIYATIGIISVKILRKYAKRVKNCGKIVLMTPVAIVITNFGVIYATICINSVKILRKYTISGKNCGKKVF
jgi:hypothetical protein